jgi:hypothetical protein
MVNGFPPKLLKSADKETLPRNCSCRQRERFGHGLSGPNERGGLGPRKDRDVSANSSRIEGFVAHFCGAGKPGTVDHAAHSPQEDFKERMPY